VTSGRNLAPNVQRGAEVTKIHRNEGSFSSDPLHCTKSVPTVTSPNDGQLASIWTPLFAKEATEETETTYSRWKICILQWIHNHKTWFIKAVRTLLVAS